MSWVNIQYESNLRKNDKRDGMKALAVYCLIMCSAFFQGWLYTTNAKIFVLNLSQIWIPLIMTAPHRQLVLLYTASQKKCKARSNTIYTADNTSKDTAPDTTHFTG